MDTPRIFTYRPLFSDPSHAGKGTTAANLHMEDVNLADIAEKYGTPCYVYSQTLIERNADAVLSGLANVCKPPALVAYACKANNTMAVLRILAAMGCGADIVSGGELTKALVAGIPPRNIVFSGVGKNDMEIRSALENNIAQINVESSAEMSHISSVACSMKKPAPISFRLNPDVDARTHKHTKTGHKESKFGISAEEIREMYARAEKDPWLKPCGLSVHIGSQLTTIEPFREAFKVVRDFTLTLRQEGRQVHSLDLGGGIGISYNRESLFPLNDYFSLIREMIVPLGTSIILEPGRRITGDAGLLLCKVLYTKEAGRKRFLVVDAGMTDFMRPSLYEAIHPVLPVDDFLLPCPSDKRKNDKTWPHSSSALIPGDEADRDGIYPSLNATSEWRTYDIVGPVCETADVLATNVLLPPAIEQSGKLIAFMAAGAYGSVMASFYNARPLPAEILVRRKNHFVLRPSLSIQDLLKKEKIPRWLEKRVDLR